jgi:hypothetical protein
MSRMGFSVPLRDFAWIQLILEKESKIAILASCKT